MFKYINSETNEIICLKDEVYWIGYNFYHKRDLYKIIDKKYING
jgi:hypothetical protein